MAKDVSKSTSELVTLKRSQFLGVRVTGVGATVAYPDPWTFHAFGLAARHFSFYPFLVSKRSQRTNTLLGVPPPKRHAPVFA